METIGAIILVSPKDSLPKSTIEAYRNAFFANFRDDLFREVFDKMVKENPQYDFVLHHFIPSEKEQLIVSSLKEEKIQSVILYENIDGKDIYSLVRGDQNLSKYFV